MSILERSTLRPKCIQLVSGGARIHIQDFLSTKLIDLTMPRSEQGKMEVEMKEVVSSACQCARSCAGGGGRKDPKTLQTGHEPLWTLPLWKKTSQKKMRGAWFFSIFFNVRENEKGWRQNGI